MLKEGKDYAETFASTICGDLCVDNFWRWIEIVLFFGVNLWEGSKRMERYDRVPADGRIKGYLFTHIFRHIMVTLI
jgi:hypothetical protein